MIVKFPRKLRVLDHLNLTLIWTFFAILISYFFIDVPLAEYFKSIPATLQSSAQFFSDLIDPKYQLFAWPIFFFIFRFILKKEFLANRCLLILISIAVANFLSTILKEFLGRARPELLFSHGQYGFTLFSSSNLYTSFPSGHACAVGAICGAVAYFYPRYWLPIVCLGFVLAMTRVILTAHFASDVIAGEILGFLTAQLIYKAMKKEHISFSRR